MDPCKLCQTALRAEDEKVTVRVSFYRVPPYKGKSETFSKSLSYAVHAMCADAWVHFSLTGTKE